MMVSAPEASIVAARKRPCVWWASPCGGGAIYPDREEAEFFGQP